MISITQKMIHDYYIERNLVRWSVHLEITPSPSLRHPVGGLLLSVEPLSLGRLSGFYLEEGWRNMGYGSLLLGVALEMAKQHRARAVALTVFESNRGAIRLYEKFGFERHTNLGGAIEMVKVL